MGTDAAANGDNLLKSSLAAPLIRRRRRFDRDSIASLRIKNDILTVALRACVPRVKITIVSDQIPVNSENWNCVLSVNLDERKYARKSSLQTLQAVASGCL